MSPIHQIGGVPASASQRTGSHQGAAWPQVARAALFAALCAAMAAALTGCSSVGGGVGIGIPVGPVTLGVGLGSGGVSAQVGTGWGPLGAGVGVHPNGQVTGSAGVGVSTGVGPARVGAGVGGTTVLHDPQAQPGSFPAAPDDAVSPGGVQWRDASGRVVPACRVQGTC